MKHLNLTLAMLGGLLFISCSKEVCDEENSALSTSGTAASARINPSQGMVYTMSNGSTQNSILAYLQNSNGTLTFMGETASGGTGTGSGLGSQGALIHNFPETWLFAVNAGSNSISSFHIHSDGSLQLLSTVPSGGVRPVSLAVYNDWLYVANAGSSNVSGFNVNFDGTLSPIANSTLPLSSANADPGDIEFTPGGKALLVTEKATNKLAAFLIDPLGKTGPPTFLNTTGQPFALSFVRGTATGTDFMLLPETMQSEVRIGTYAVNGAGIMSFSQQSITTHQSGSGWVVTTNDGFNSFVSNTGSNSISSIKSGNGGSLTLAHDNASNTDSQPQDIALSGNEKYIYNISRGNHALTGYKRTNSEALSRLSTVNLPASASGLAAVNKMFY